MWFFLHSLERQTLRMFGPVKDSLENWLSGSRFTIHQKLFNKPRLASGIRQFVHKPLRMGPRGNLERQHLQVAYQARLDISGSVRKRSIPWEGNAIARGKTEILFSQEEVPVRHLSGMVSQ